MPEFQMPGHGLLFFFAGWLDFPSVALGRLANACFFGPATPPRKVLSPRRRVLSWLGGYYSPYDDLVRRNTIKYVRRVSLCDLVSPRPPSKLPHPPTSRASSARTPLSGLSSVGVSGELNDRSVMKDTFASPGAALIVLPKGWEVESAFFFHPTPPPIWVFTAYPGGVLAGFFSLIVLAKRARFWTLFPPPSRPVRPYEGQYDRIAGSSPFPVASEIRDRRRSCPPLFRSHCW